MIEQHIMKDHDFIFDKSGGEIKSAGFTVDSILMQKGEPPLITRNSGNQIGGNVADLFKDLAVPAGLVYFNRKQFGGNEKTKVQNNDTFISNDIHEKLLKLVEVNDELKRPRKTRRETIKSKIKTKKHKPK